MKLPRFANAPSLLTIPPVPLAPSRCPYCPAGAPKHWKRHGRYRRYGGDPQEPSRKVDVFRFLCKIVGRTFSLPPDALLPFCGIRTGFVLQALYELSVHDVPVNTLARRAGVGRGALRHLRARFLRAIPRLRLPWREGMVHAADFLKALARSGAAVVAALFRDWKEREPKLSVVGIYAR